MDMDGSNGLDGRRGFVANIDACEADAISADDSYSRALAHALTQKAGRLCRGLPDGEADILELVTPVTAHLLRWWFGRDACRSRALNFHAGQTQAILNTIVAHEVCGVSSLRSLYEIAAPEIPLRGAHLLAMVRPQHFHPCYCISASIDDDRQRVLQALLVWQLLNKSAALAQGLDDLRFTRRFLLLAADGAGRDCLQDIFRGREVRGHRDFATSTVVLHAELLLPMTCRSQALDIWRTCTADADVIARYDRKGTFIAIAQDFSDVELEFFAALPDLMVVDGGVGAIDCGAVCDDARRKRLDRLAESKGRRLLRVDFLPGGEGLAAATGSPLNIIADIDQMPAMS